MLTEKYRRLSLAGAPEMPGGGSAISRSVSLRIRRGSPLVLISMYFNKGEGNFKFRDRCGRDGQQVEIKVKCGGFVGV